MATFRGTAVVSEIRGSVGNVTYSRNRGGNYSKVRKKPINPRTALQQTNRARITQANTLWKALTEAERFHFEQIAKQHSSKDRLGQTIGLGGYQLYVRFYMIHALIGRTTPTTIQAPNIPSTFRVTRVFSTTTVIGFDQFVNLAIIDVGAFVYASPPRIATRKGINPSLCRYLTVVAPISGVTTVDLTSNWTARFGSLASNSGKITTLAFRSLAVASAQLGELQCYNVLIP